MPTELLGEAEEGFVDLAFDARVIDGAPSGHLRIHLQAQHDGQRVGLVAEVVTDLIPGLAGVEVNRAAFRREAVRFLADGVATDRLVTAFARASRIEPLGRATRPELVFTAFPLQETAVDPMAGPCKLKLFHDDRSEHDEYAEAFFNLELPHGRAWLNEKDPHYRPYWVRAWSQRSEPWSRVVLQRDPGGRTAHVDTPGLERAVREAERGDVRRVLLSDAEGGQLVLARTEHGLGLLLVGWDPEARTTTHHLAVVSKGATDVVSSWSIEGAIGELRWQPVLWEQVAGVFGARR
ncbi:MAG: hypothetical protein H6735_28755 [Alphaproteobacteria bacterium]|nr:hypothetical protein [Alphaproteobacteria bacterium]